MFKIVVSRHGKHLFTTEKMDTYTPRAIDIGEEISERFPDCQVVVYQITNVETPIQEFNGGPTT